MIDFLLGLAVGGLLMFVYMRWNQPPPGPRRYDVHVTTVDTQHLHHIGELKEADEKWLANRALDGFEFTYRKFCRKWGEGGKLSEEKFKKVRAELVRRGMAGKAESSGEITLWPPAFALFRMIAGRRGKEGSRKGNQEGVRR
jgi:hypothetical protein